MIFFAITVIFFSISNILFYSKSTKANDIFALQMLSNDTTNMSHFP